MKTIEFSSIPSLRFTHMFKAWDYQNHFNPLKNFIEIAYILDGVHEIDDGTEKYIAQKDDVICLIRDGKIDVSSKGYSCHLTVGINIDYTLTQDSIGGVLLPVVISAKNNTSEIRQRIDWFVHNHIICEQSPIKSSAGILDLFCKIDECSRRAISKKLPADYLHIYKAKQYINRNIYEHIEQKSVAKHLGITPEYLCSIFKKSEGITLMHYINTEKLKSIKTLIDTKNMPLYEASSVYGYSDPNYVSRLYKKIFGYNITDMPNKK